MRLVGGMAGKKKDISVGNINLLLILLLLFGTHIHEEEGESDGIPWHLKWGLSAQ